MERGIKPMVGASSWMVAACLIVTLPVVCIGQADRETWQPPEKIMDAIGVRPGMRVGEAGAGRGYFTFPLARRVGPQGVIFANDISTTSLEVVRERALKEGLGNIKTAVGEVENPLFPEKNLDMIVMVYVLHELERPIPFVRNLHTYLRPGGSLVIIERNTSVENTQSHSFMTNGRIRATMSETGYELDRTETFLPRDTIYIYKTSQRSQPRGTQPPAGMAASGAPDRALDVTYIANEGFLVRAAGKKVMIAAPIVMPVIASSSAALKAITEGREPFDDLDLILITHMHADHFHPARLIACLRSNPKARLVAPTQAVDPLRRIDGFAGVEKQIQEIKGEAGAREQVKVNGIVVEILCLALKGGVTNLAFVVNLNGLGFLHMGDGLVEDNLSYLSAFPFNDSPVDVVSLDYRDRSPATREFVGRKIKPSRIIVMHIPPAETADELKKIWGNYPFAIVFRKSMEQLSVLIEIDYHHLTGDYFGQPEPGATPQAFARGIVSSDLQEHGAPSFSLDGNELVWASARKPGPDSEQWIVAAMTMRRENGRWSAPYVPAPDRHVLSADGRRAYFTESPAPGGPSFPDIWFAEKQGQGWSEPKSLNLVARYPELRFAMGPVVARDGNLYFLAYTPGPLNNYGIYRSELVNGEYAKPELLPRSINLPPFLNWTLFIEPDESYLLFSSNRRDPGHDAGDLYISHRQADGSWTDPVSLGEPVNTNRQERFPVISNDGKYLFFSRQTPDHDEDVFWVDAAAIPALRPVTNPPNENSK